MATAPDAHERIADAERMRPVRGPDETVPDEERTDDAPETSDAGGDSDPSESAGADPEAPRPG